MGKRMRRLIALAVAAAMVVSAMSGCGSERVSRDSDDVITLRILENDTAKEEGYLDELINAFNEAYADKGIQAADANMDEYSDLAENGPYGYGPDVLYQANDKLMTYAEDKHLLAITPSDFDCYDYTSEETWGAFEINVDGEVYTCGIPVNVQVPMLFYRTDMLPGEWKTKWDDNSNGVPDFLRTGMIYINIPGRSGKAKMVAASMAICHRLTICISIRTFYFHMVHISLARMQRENRTARI